MNRIEFVLICTIENKLIFYIFLIKMILLLFTYNLYLVTSKVKYLLCYNTIFHNLYDVNHFVDYRERFIFSLYIFILQ